MAKNEIILPMGKNKKREEKNHTVSHTPALDTPNSYTLHPKPKEKNGVTRKKKPIREQCFYGKI